MSTTEPLKVPRRRRAAATMAAWQWTVLAQGVGVGMVVFGVALILSAAWAVLVGGVLVLAAGSLAEATQVRAAAAGRKRRLDDVAARRAA